MRIIKTLAERLKDRIHMIIVTHGPLVKLYNTFNGLSSVSIIDHQLLNNFVKIPFRFYALFMNRYGLFALLPLDILSAGNLVVSFNVRGFIRDYVLNNLRLRSFVVDFGNVNKLINRIMELINLWYDNEDEYHNLINYARYLVKKFLMNRIANVCLDLFFRVFSS